MINRYTRERMKSIWDDRSRLATWLEVELAAMVAMEEEGIVPAGTAKKIKGSVTVDVERMLEIENKTHHDVIAFTRMISEQLGKEGRWLHYGLTSSDVVDTALCLLIKRSVGFVIGEFELLAEAIKKRAYEHRHQVMVGRTHGVHAEPTTFGFKLALWYSEVMRDIERLRKAEDVISVGKFSGAVGTFAHLKPSVEARACEILGLKPSSVSSQIIQRDRHADVMASIAICAGSLEKFATEIRHLQRTEVREVEEPFAKGQAGSSSMPHKRNPVKCENVCGLARLVKSYTPAALDNIPLWHERDISHSSVERVIFPDAFILLDFITDRFKKIVEGMLVYPDAMKRNLEKMKGLVYSGTALLKLVEKGLSREEAYEIVQRCAMKVWEEDKDFKDFLALDKEAMKRLGEEGLDDIFNTAGLLGNVDKIFERVFGKHN